MQLSSQRLFQQFLKMSSNCFISLPRRDIVLLSMLFVLFLYVQETATGSQTSLNERRKAAAVQHKRDPVRAVPATRPTRKPRPARARSLSKAVPVSDVNSTAKIAFNSTRASFIQQRDGNSMKGKAKNLAQFRHRQQCIVTDLFATTPHGSGLSPGLDGTRADGTDRLTYRESRMSPFGKGGIVCISAAIPAYSDYSRPSADILQRSGYNPFDMPDKNRNGAMYECEEKREPEDPVDCRNFLAYRSFQGDCNNLINPTWGNQTQPYSRISGRTYADGKDAPRLFSAVEEGDSKLPLPNPRAISIVIGKSIPVPHPVANIFLPIFGQFIAHDLALTPSFQVNNRQPDCCVVNADCSVPECFQFSVPPFDPFYARFNITCHQFVRSLPSIGARCTTGIREQFSTVTHWLDASQVYGSSEKQNGVIRTFFDGLLRQRDVDSGAEDDPATPVFKQMLPSLPPNGPSSCKALDPHRTCFLAGDDRVNQQPMLASIHVVFLRYHNLVAGYLSSRFPSWPDETVFQEARKFVVAVYQIIVFKEFLPTLLGESGTEVTASPSEAGPLTLLEEGYFQSYDDSYDPHVVNEFTSAAFRLHTIVSDHLPRLVLVTGTSDNNMLSSQFNNQTLLYEEGNADAILSGMLEEPTLAFDGHSSLEIQGRMFRGNLPFGLDLISIDFQRGRDHGIGTYNDLREACGFGRAASFSELQDLMTQENSQLLHSLYRHVDDIDLMAGGLLERPVNSDASVGPTFACIIALEFHGKRLADRYWHENPDQFTEDQLQQLRQVTIAEVLCQTTALRTVPSNAFAAVSETNSVMPCKLAPELDLHRFFELAKDDHEEDHPLNQNHRLLYDNEPQYPATHDSPVHYEPNSINEAVAVNYRRPYGREQSLQARHLAKYK